MQQLISPIESQEDFEATVCRHYWVIEPAEGLVSKGICRHCDEIRDFKNYVEENDWMDDRVVVSSTVTLE